MKSKLHKAKLVCCLLALLITFQSCVSYKNTNISIDDAVKTNRKVLVTTTAKTKLRLDKIEKNDSLYYGIKKGKQIPLQESEILTIHPYDKSSSTISTLVVIIFPLLVAIVIASQDYAPDVGGFGDEN